MAQAGGLRSHSRSDVSAGPRDYVDHRSSRSASEIGPLPKKTNSPPRGPPQSSPERNQQQKQRPIQDAVNSAFEGGDATPDLVAQVTERVLNSLKASGLTTSPTNTTSPTPMTGSTTSIPVRDVYTPPSPDRPEDVSQQTPQNEFGNDGIHDSLERDVSPRRPSEKPSSPPKDETVRPKPPERTPTSDATILEKCWQPLFEAGGNPTQRVGQFLRGLGNHLIEDYEPQFSLVITPAKMLRFYEETKLQDEIYPWAAIFGGKISNSAVSHLYRDLGCAHHFVQTAYDEKPSIPALTPIGFERWITQFIRAHPSLEFERLAKATLHMPINNADDRKERFPKELSRRLFPATPNDEIRWDIEDAVLQNKNLELTPQVSQSSATPGGPSPQRPRGSAPPSTNLPPPTPDQMLHPSVSASAAERDRKKYSDSSSEVAVEDGPSNPGIERERKPYAAAPGGGKVFGEDLRPTRSDTIPHRSNTTGTSARPVLDPQDEYSARARADRRRSQAGYSPYRTRRSPSASNRSNPLPRSETDIPPYNPYYDGGQPPPPPPPGDGPPLQKQFSREERPRGFTNDDPRRYQPPPPPPAGYEEEFYRRGPPPAPPSSFPPSSFPPSSYPPSAYQPPNYPSHPPPPPRYP